MIEYEKFKQELREVVQKEMPDCATIRFVMIRKNNQVEKEEILCEMPEKNLTPAVPIKELYERYLEKGMDWCVEELVKIFQTGDKVSGEELFQTWEEVKPKIYIELVNHAWNEELLKTTPHKDFLDLAIVFRARLCETKIASAGYCVTEQIMEHWGISVEELYQEALRNLSREEFEIIDVLQKIPWLSGNQPKGETEENTRKEPEEAYMFLYTNKSGVKGASGMLRTDLLEEFAQEQDCDLIILPSSVHELLLLPDRGNHCIEAVRTLVREVNREVLEKEEWLSDEVYIYRRNAGEVELLS